MRCLRLIAVLGVLLSGSPVSSGSSASAGEVRPSWVDRAVYEQGGYIYFVGSSYDDALRLAVQGVYQVVTSEFSSYQSERVSGSGSIHRGFVEDRLTAISKDIQLYGLRQVDSHGDMVLLRISDRDYEAARGRVLHRLKEEKRLSKGSRVVGSIVSVNGSDVHIRVTELNGVAVVLDSAELVVRKQNRFASTISYYVVHVPEKSQERVSVSLVPVRVCGGSQEIRVSVEDGKGLSDYLLGADIRRTLVLRGVDEVGGSVTLKVAF